jgi:hypothetical protein
MRWEDAWELEKIPESLATAFLSCAWFAVMLR